MKNYDKSIKYMKNEMNKQTEAHRQPYRDAIEAMEYYNRMAPRLERAKCLCNQMDILNTQMIESKLFRNKKGCLYDRNTRL